MDFILWFWDGWVFLKGRKPVAQLETRVEACFDHTGKARCFATNLKNIGTRILKIYDWILETVINKPILFYISIYKLISSYNITLNPKSQYQTCRAKSPACPQPWLQVQAQHVHHPDCKHVHHPDCKSSRSTTLTTNPACPPDALVFLNWNW